MSEIHESLEALAATFVDFMSMSEDDVIAETLRLGGAHLGAGESAMVAMRRGGQWSVRSASSAGTRRLQTAACGRKESPLRRCVDSASAVHAEFHPSNGWYDEHGAESLNAGIHHEYALPLRNGTSVEGVFVWSRGHELPAGRVDTAHAELLVAAASLRVSLGWSLAAATTLAAQLGSALATRTTIEQAKGVVAGREGIDLVRAFEGLRGAARASGRRLVDVAAEVIAQPGTIARRTGRSQPG